MNLWCAGLGVPAMYGAAKLGIEVRKVSSIEAMGFRSVTWSSEGGNGVIKGELG